MSNIRLYNQAGWVDTIKGLDKFGIVPEIRAQGTISKGYGGEPTQSGDGTKPVKLDHFLVHREPEPVKTTKTLPEILECYHVEQKELKTLHISIPDPAMCFKTGRFKFGKKSGVLCSSDDNVVGRPLQDLDAVGVKLHQGVFVNCEGCPFNKNGTCNETVLVLCTISAPNDETPAPCGQMLFKMTLPRTARNPFFGDYALAMQLSYNTVLRYGLDHSHFPQAVIPYKVSLALRNGQYFDEKKKSQTRTTYYVPQIGLDYERLCSRLEKFAEQFGGKKLYAGMAQKALPEEVLSPVKGLFEDEETSTVPNEPPFPELPENESEPEPPAAPQPPAPKSVTPLAKVNGNGDGRGKSDTAATKKADVMLLQQCEGQVKDIDQPYITTMWDNHAKMNLTLAQWHERLSAWQVEVNKHVSQNEQWNAYREEIIHADQDDDTTVNPEANTINDLLVKGDEALASAQIGSLTCDQLKTLNVQVWTALEPYVETIPANVTKEILVPKLIGALEPNNTEMKDWFTSDKRDLRTLYRHAKMRKLI